MRIVIAPTTFKGSLSALEAAEAMARGVLGAEPTAQTVLRPVGDGGEGTASALLRSVPDSREEHRTVFGPLREPVDASFALLGPEHKTAALDMASAAGLPLIPPSQRNPMETTTYGVGELIRTALATAGVDQLIVGLGGSATNDCGAGCLQALGFDLLDEAGAPLPAPALPRDLARVLVVDGSGVDPHLLKARVVLACDVDNPLTGPRGASIVFGPQKGATPEMVEELDGLLAHFGAALDEWARGCNPAGGYVPITIRPGSGAAGGLGAALMTAFPNAEVKAGIDVVLDCCGFDRELEGADLVLTGEGKLDLQTLGGKAIQGVLRRAVIAGVPVVAIVGAADEESVAALTKQGLSRVIQLVDLAGSVDEAITQADRFVSEAARLAVTG